MQSLLHQMRQLKEENEELQAQMSSLGSSQSRQPQSQWTASRRTDEIPRNTEFLSGSRTTWYEEELSPARQVQLDKGTDSTRVSTKRRHEKKSCLSYAMRAQLEP